MEVSLKTFFYGVYTLLSSYFSSFPSSSYPYLNIFIWSDLNSPFGQVTILVHVNWCFSASDSNTSTDATLVFGTQRFLKQLLRTDIFFFSKDICEWYFLWRIYVTGNSHLFLCDTYCITVLFSWSLTNTLSH